MKLRGFCLEDNYSCAYTEESEEDLKWNVEKLHEAMKRHRLKVNWSKSNTMVL